MKRNRIVAVGLILLLVFLSACDVGAKPTPTPEAELDTATVVSATGKVVPAVWAAVSTPVGGPVVEVLVEQGDMVNAGRVLVRLDSAEAQLAVRQAEAALQTAQAQLDLLQAGARTEDVAVARSARNQAQAGLDELNGTLAAATEQARLSWVQSANALRDAQANYQNIYWENRELEEKIDKEDMPDEKIDAETKAWHAVQNAEAAMEQARLAYEQAAKRQETLPRSAQAQVESAGASLERVSSGARSEEVAVATATVAQAEVALEVAKVTLGRCEVRAPFAGTVTTVHVRVGEMVTPGQPLVTLGDLATLRIETTDLDEIDISRVAVGQQATIAFDALPEQVFAGRVLRISPMAEPGSGGVNFTTLIELEQVSPAIRWGMTAFVDIEVEQ